ncbi:helix-turn-helix domain-containing protein [Spirosoma sp. HMF4905]|uniref:Helix-turn-helix domain-containing protein n=1 Tax=Spirosoma arboris TaxID=2682092 RepID=A0A7K1S852_9BACT|nr:helix-turn-helix transcriptional regulator [Spirosoma arboris]MVM29959.1 helix-turn-helix domain-containing protein [Spirosoma arboris]
MKKEVNHPRIINSISEWHRVTDLPKPEHPLISLIHHADVKTISDEHLKGVVINFYIISVKKDFKGKMKYGKNYYDFDEGTMTFVSPGQVLAVEDDESRDCSGWSLLVHPDFIRSYPLGKTIKTYGFFSYEVTEALHLSDKEDALMESLIRHIEQEYHSSIDNYSQDVMVSHLDLLLNYANRFYNRQFITRKNASHDLLTNLEELLSDYFGSSKVQEMGLPTVQYISETLNVSPNYLSDLLRKLTGQSTQQHIQNKLIEKAKEILTTTTLSVSEIAYQLGFEYPQSFNKLFKSKTHVSPLEFRQSFN